MNTPIAITITEAVKLSGLSRSRIYECLQARKITGLKAGRRTLIPYAELQAYLAGLPTFQAGA
ncbi:MAG: excisionase family DNA-binding protein [Novosphingobium sp.]